MSLGLNLIRPALVTPLAVSAGLGLGLAVGSSAVALSPAAASAIGVAITSVACSSTSGCIVGSNSGSGPGVAGTSSKGTGVNGTSTSSYGVYGTSKSGVGVKAVSSSSSAIYATNNSGTYPTINALSTGTSGDAVHATSYDGDGLIADSGVDTGVIGTGLLQGAAFEGTTNAGVSGTTRGSEAAGVFGYDETDAGEGSYAVQGESPHNVAGSFLNDSGNSADVLDVQGGTTSAGNYLMSVHSSNSSKYMSVDDSGNIFYTGGLFHETACHGCHAGTRVRSYAPHESEPTMEDVGSGRLTNGNAYVALDPTFSNVVDAATDYHVLVTPEGDSNGVFVTARTNRGFFVHENHGGRSSVAFSYRIVAKPYGSAQPRLPTIQAVGQHVVHSARKAHRPLVR